MEELEPVKDLNGEERRCGSLPIPEGYVCSVPTFEAAFANMMLERADVLKLVRDPNRVPARIKFGAKFIQNQQSHGSCNGHLVAGVVSRLRFRRGLGVLKLSGAYPYSKMNGGRDNGSLLADGIEVAKTYGLPPESLVPWNQIYPRQQPSNADAEAAKIKGLEPSSRITTRQGLETALALQMDVGVAVHVGNSYMRLDGKGVSGIDGGPGNHAVVCDDLYEEGGDLVYDQPNSWGLAWGQEGHTKLRWEHFAQTINNHVFYTFRSTLETEDKTP